MKLEKICDQILTVGESIGYVRFIDENGKLIYDKTKKDKILLQDQKPLREFSSELHIMKQMQQLFDESLGAARFVHVIRDNVHQFIYYASSMIVYITCERNTDPYDVLEIVNKINSIISHL